MPHTQTTNCWNLKVCVELNQGGRKYMEDMTSVKFERSKYGKNTVEYAAFAVYDGHGGKDAAFYARDHLLDNLKQQKGFYVSDPASVKQAISDAFYATHLAMWKVLYKWPKTANGHPSTAGTTASVVIIRGNKMYVANVGDSMVVMGVKDHNAGWDEYECLKLTIDHKPELEKEKTRIEGCGGFIVKKQGVNRVVWLRPQLPGNSGPVRRSTSFDKIPFLAVSRSLGDLWSFNPKTDDFIVSPIPDVYDYDLHQDKNQFLILASDGLWNMVNPDDAVTIVAKCEKEKQDGNWNEGPANSLVRTALKTWKKKNLRADNTSVITVIIDRAKLGKKLRKEVYCDAWVSGNSKSPVNGPKETSDNDKVLPPEEEDSKQPIQRAVTSSPPPPPPPLPSQPETTTTMTSSPPGTGEGEPEVKTMKREHSGDDLGDSPRCGKRQRSSSSPVSEEADHKLFERDDADDDL